MRLQRGLAFEMLTLLIRYLREFKTLKKANQRDPSEELLASQKEWLKKRDACGADTACLEEEMFGRVGYLVQKTNW